MVGLGVLRSHDEEFEGWYVNIEDPHTRSGLATHTRDHVLDVDVQPDRSHQRKDEDELILAVEQGRYHADEAGRSPHWPPRSRP